MIHRIINPNIDRVLSKERLQEE